MNRIQSTKALKKFVSNMKPPQDAQTNVRFKAFIFNNKVFSLSDRAKVINATNLTLNGCIHTDHHYDMHPYVTQKLGEVGLLKSHVQYQQIKDALFDRNDETSKAIAEALGKRSSDDNEPEEIDTLKSEIVEEIEKELSTTKVLSRKITASFPRENAHTFATTGIVESEVYQRQLHDSMLDLYNLNRTLNLGLKMVVRSFNGYYEVTTTRKGILYRKVSAVYFDAKSNSRIQRHGCTNFTEVKTVVDMLDFEGARKSTKRLMNILNKYHKRLFE